MKQWQQPRLVFLGNVSDLTQSKSVTGTDAFSGGHPQPGGTIGMGNEHCLSSQDDVITLPPCSP